MKSFPGIPNPPYCVVMETVRAAKVKALRERCGGALPLEREGWRYNKDQPVILTAWIRQREQMKGS